MAELTEQYLKRRVGNHWVFPIAIEDGDGNEKDCTGHDSMMAIRRYVHSGHEDPKVAVRHVHITWTNQGAGAGNYTLAPDVTKEFFTGEYDYECYLYKDDKTFRRIVSIGKINALRTVEKEIILRD